MKQIHIPSNDVISTIPIAIGRGEISPGRNRFLPGFSGYLFRNDSSDYQSSPHYAKEFWVNPANDNRLGFIMAFGARLNQLTGQGICPLLPGQ